MTKQAYYQSLVDLAEGLSEFDKKLLPRTMFIGNSKNLLDAYSKFVHTGLAYDDCQFRDERCSNFQQHWNLTPKGKAVLTMIKAYEDA